MKKKKKGNADGTAVCIIHVVVNAKDKVSGFTEQSQKVQSPCFRLYYMHDFLSVLTFQVVYIVCVLSKKKVIKIVYEHIFIMGMVVFSS